MDLTDKIALVTGASRRIGRVIALVLARAGADVVVHYNHSQSEAEATAGEIAAAGRRAKTVRADLSEPDQIAKMFDAIAEKFARLDVLVNNAAVFERTPIETFSAERWDAQMNVNVRAPALCIRHAIGLMPNGGAIVNITDIAADRPWPGYAAYCASKAALLGLTKSAALALAGRNIRVNAVAPGMVLRSEGVPEKEQQNVIARIPLKRPGRPEDIAAAVVFLAQHDYITGQTLRIDGGWCMG